jgi:hypothetical protein
MKGARPHAHTTARMMLPSQLLAPNLGVAAKIERKEPVTSSAVPKNYQEAKILVTADCIQPAQD